MIGEYGAQGWNLPFDETDEGEEGGGKYSAEERLFRFRFKMPDAAHNPLEVGRPVTHRVLILNESPFTFYEHSLYSWRGCGHWTALCLKKNKIDDRGCPLCSKTGGDNWPSCVGMFSIIDLGQVTYEGKDAINLTHRTWEDKDGTVHEDSFPRVIMGPKMGSKKTPGVLMKLFWQAERRGESLEGTVWDTSRSGDKEAGVGETWEYVDRVAPTDYIAYLQKYGADPAKLNVEPITNWREICKPLTYETLANIVGMGSGNVAQSKSGGSRSEGAGYSSGVRPNDDDIPF